MQLSPVLIVPGLPSSVWCCALPSHFGSVVVLHDVPMGRPAPPGVLILLAFPRSGHILPRFQWDHMLALLTCVIDSACRTAHWLPQRSDHGRDCLLVLSHRQAA